MAKIVTVQFLVSEEDESDIMDGLNDALRTIVNPMGSGSAEGSFIIDYNVALRMRDAGTEIAKSIQAGTYSEGSSFPGDEHYALIIEGDVNMLKLGPFADPQERDAAAREHRKEFGTDDGVHWLQVSPAGFVEVGDYTGDELEDQSEAKDLANRLFSGERIIVRQPNWSCFMLKMGDQEKPVDRALIEEIQGHCYEDLVICRDGETEYVIPASQARAFFKQEDWVNAVVWKETMASFFEWVSQKVNQLDKALDAK